MKIHQYLLAFVLFSFIIASTLFVFNDINESYGGTIDIDDDFEGTYNQINETYDLSQDVKEDVVEQKIGSGDESWESMTKGSYKSTKRSITGSFGIVGATLNDVSKAIGIPDFIIVFAITAIVIVSIFSLIYMIFRYGN